MTRRTDRSVTFQCATEEAALDSLVPWSENPRINDATVPAVARSIERFGWLVPIVARRSDRRVLAGHTRLKAAQQLGLDTVPVVWAELGDGDAAAFALADNRTAELSEWEPGGLAEILQRLRDEDIDVELAGFSDLDVDELLATLGEGESGPGPAGKKRASSKTRKKPSGERAAIVSMVLSVPQLSAIVEAVEDEVLAAGCPKGEALLRLCQRAGPAPPDAT